MKDYCNYKDWFTQHSTGNNYLIRPLPSTSYKEMAFRLGHSPLVYCNGYRKAG